MPDVSVLNDLGNIEWGGVKSSQFWQLADDIQNATLAKADGVFSYLANATIEDLKEILIQYRYFTVYYIPDLALLVARLPDGPMRSFIADILNDELGVGNPKLAHPQLYDNFLRSIGVDVSLLAGYALEDNVTLLDEARRHLVDPARRSEYAIGLRGMGGECVCQVYIAQLHKYLVQNPYIRERGGKIDWHFWKLHVGDHDIAHREHTRALIDTEIVEKGGEGLTALGQGYAYSVAQWQAFWTSIFRLKEEAGSAYAVPRGTVRSFVNVAVHN